MEITVFGDPVVFTLGPMPVTRTVLTSLGVSAGVLALAGALRAAVLRVPGSRAAVVGELAVRWPEQLVYEIVGRPIPWLATFSGTLFYWLAACAVSGQLPGVRAPTANLAVTSALAIVVFVTVPAAGIRAQGFKRYFGHYLQPSPFMLPLEVMSELSRTFALAVRLFGNMVSGYLIVALIVALVGAFIPTPLMALDLLIGLLQAYIFAVLATVYVGAALRVREES